MSQKIIKQRQKLTDIQLSSNPLLNRLYQAREIQDPKQLDYNLKNLYPPNLFSNIDKAIDLLINIYHQKKRITIIGDFDADGATSTSLCILALRKLGFLSVDYLIPDRFTQGYGLSIDVAKMAIEQGAEVVITVDNGVSSVEGVALLKEHNIQVLITDHHLPPDELPNADAIINPNLSDCHFPSKSLAGVGVIFYVMLALRSRMRELNLFKEQQPNLAELLDLVALGTVADVVSLDHNNRILVQQGITRMRNGYCRVGIKALFEIAKRDLTKLKASDLGFAIAPRLNAAGRLENMALGVELLICEEMGKACQIAFELDSLNQTRKEFEEEMKVEALSICAKLPNLSQNIKAHGIVLYQPDWHQGVIGILASRIKEQFNRPVIAFAQESNESEFIKGSARSISGLHMRDLLELIDQKYPNLILKFGGHAMAAGLTIHQDNFLQFQQAFDEMIYQILNPEQLQNIIYTDGELLPNEFNLETAYLIQQNGPWGQSFPEPLFEGEFKIIQQRLVGGKHLKMMVEIYNQLFDAILFNVDLSCFPDLSIKTARLVYSLDINEFRGNISLQLLVKDIL